MPWDMLRRCQCALTLNDYSIFTSVHTKSALIPEVQFDLYFSTHKRCSDTRRTRRTGNKKDGSMVSTKMSC